MTHLFCCPWLLYVSTSRHENTTNLDPEAMAFSVARAAASAAELGAAAFIGGRNSLFHQKFQVPKLED